MCGITCRGGKLAMSGNALGCCSMISRDIYALLAMKSAHRSVRSSGHGISRKIRPHTARENLFCVVEVVVQRGVSRAQTLRQASHADRIESLVVDDVQSRLDSDLSVDQWCARSSHISP